ncbi:MFS transporter [Actinomyces naeslundii]|uniref:Transporter, major facilitator family protein n=2 Tax=Actinomyces naeslundii TaxID=1655 RepID=J3JLG9_ACTNH|nr:MFS transporter [Actinomyces naeslundii]EJN86234.1 transporter, major facilitator family protein [Actinomyces naeslundii str. Howell 279]OMG38203.1 MFS transporter [Actinomyces naeslundii]
MDRKLSLLGFAVMFLIGSDTFVVAPLMPSLAKAFDVSTTQSGWLVSVYAIGYALTGLASGPISDRGNRRIILTLGMVVFALATAACAASPGFWTMFIFRFITGGAAAVAAPQVWAMIPTLVGPDQKIVLRVMGYTTAGLSIAQVVGVPLGSLLAIINWRIVFPVIGVCALALTVTLWHQIPDIRPTVAAKKVPYLTLLHVPQAITRFLSYLVYTLAFFTVFTYAPTWLEDGLGTSKTTVALIVLAGGIGNTIGSLFGVRLTGRMTPAQAIYLSAAVMGIAYLTLAASPAPIFVGLVFLPLFACGGAMLSVRMLHLQQLDSTARGTISTLTSAVMYIGTTVAGLIGGPLLTLTGNFAAIGITAFLLSTVSALMIRPSRLRTEVDDLTSIHHLGEP